MIHKTPVANILRFGIVTAPPMGSINQIRADVKRESLRKLTQRPLIWTHPPSMRPLTRNHPPGLRADCIMTGRRPVTADEQVESRQRNPQESRPPTLFKPEPRR